MRCKACNAELSDFESTRKSLDTNEFIDLCNNCYSHVKSDVVTIERFDLTHESDEEIFLIDEDISDDM